MSTLINKDQANQAASVIFKSILGFIPGGHIIDELVEYRSEIKHTRLNKFSEYVKEGFEAVTGKSFDPEDLKSVAFIDAFETIMKKVGETGSEEKIKRYRNILLRVIYEKKEDDMSFKFINLVEQLNETQILILQCLYQCSKMSEQNIIKWLANPEKYPHHLVNFIDKGEHSMYNGQKISKDEITFLVNELKSTGIIKLAPNSPQPVQYGGSMKTVDVFMLSPIGMNFINFIKEYGK